MIFRTAKLPALHSDNVDGTDFALAHIAVTRARPIGVIVDQPAGKDESGLTLLAVATLAGLFWLARSARLADQQRLG